VPLLRCIIAIVFSLLPFVGPFSVSRVPIIRFFIFVFFFRISHIQPQLHRYNHRIEVVLAEVEAEAAEVAVVVVAVVAVVGYTRVSDLHHSTRTHSKQ
jgi:hypothetical protein